MKIMYSSDVTSKGGLYGHVTSDDGTLDTDVYMPTGTEPDKQKGITPEQARSSYQQREKWRTKTFNF